MLADKRIQVHLVLPTDVYERVTMDGSLLVTIAPADVTYHDGDDHAILAFFEKNFKSTPPVTPQIHMHVAPEAVSTLADDLTNAVHTCYARDEVFPMLLDFCRIHRLTDAHDTLTCLLLDEA